MKEFSLATGADVRYVGHPAGYSEQQDYIRMPPREAFEDDETYQATLAHELIHWTKHSSRLAREFGSSVFGDQGYQKEELVGEIGAAYLCAELGLGTREAEHHTPYIASWRKGLDEAFLFTAARLAREAVDYLLALQRKQEPVPPTNGAEPR